MAYSTRLRNSRDQKRQTRTSTSNKRCLRTRRSSLRYTEDDSQSDSTELLSPAQFDLDKADVLTSKASFTFENLSSNKSFNGKMIGDGGGIVPSAMSGRSSVASCESFDSGVSSRSDEDCLPPTPEKSSKSMTIKVVSPASRGVIELIDDSNDGFIVGFFKPDIMPSSSVPEYRTDCACALRSRVTRSISTNVSDDSCDSALQNHRYPGRQESIDVIKPLSSVSEVLKIDKTPSRPLRKVDTPSDKSPKVSAKHNNNKTSRKQDSGPLKSPIRTPSKRPRTTYTQTPPKSKSAKRTSFSGKTALRRIQHHNRSPERSTDVSPTSGLHARTRSHLKSLMKAKLLSPPNKSSTIRPKLSPQRIIRNSIIPKATYSGPSRWGANQPAPPSPSIISKGLKQAGISPLKNGISPLKNGVVKLGRQKSEESESVSSDDQQAVTSSACHWRYCKAEVPSSELVDHMERLHVASQRRNSKLYKCLWEGCKVYGRVSKSIVWLEGHVRKHLGARPYYCIFPDCAARFPSHDFLQKHVASHFDENEPLKTSKKIDTVAAKKTDKKSMKRLRGTETCIPKRADFFTSNVLEAAKWEYKMLQEKWSDSVTADMSAFKLRGQIVAMATGDTSCGREDRVQIHWYPERLGLPDSWHDMKSEVASTRTKTVKLSTLPRPVLVNLLRH